MGRPERRPSEKTKAAAARVKKSVPAAKSAGKTAKASDKPTTKANGKLTAAVKAVAPKARSAAMKTATKPSALKTTPVKARPSKAGPSKAGPSKAGPSKAGPSKAGLGKAGLGKAGLGKAGLGKPTLAAKPAAKSAARPTPNGKAAAITADTLLSRVAKSSIKAPGASSTKAMRVAAHLERMTAQEERAAQTKVPAKPMTKKARVELSSIALPANYRPSDDEPFMSPKHRVYFRNKLMSWKDDILKQNRETLQVLHDDTLQHADLADRATSETERALELRARDRQRKLIAKIDAALVRIDDGSYGYCEETGEPISLKRLDARPIATLSLEAQERHERREKVYRED